METPNFTLPVKLDSNAKLGESAATLFTSGFLAHSIMVPIQGTIDEERVDIDNVMANFEDAKHQFVSQHFDGSGPTLQKNKFWAPEIGTTAGTHIGVSAVDGSRGIKTLFIVGNVASKQLQTELLQYASENPNITIGEFIDGPVYQNAKKIARANTERITSQFAEAMGLDIDQVQDYESAEVNSRREIPMRAVAASIHPTHFVESSFNSESGEKEFVLNKNCVSGQSNLKSGVLVHIDATDGSLYFPPAPASAHIIGSRMNMSFKNQHSGAVPTSLGRNIAFDINTHSHTPEAIQVKKMIASNAFHWQGKTPSSVVSRIDTVPKFNNEYTSSVQHTLEHNMGLRASTAKHLRPVAHILGGNEDL